MGKVGNDWGLKVYERCDVSFRRRILKHFIQASFRLRSSSDITNPHTLGTPSCEKNGALQSYTKASNTHSKHFVANCCCMQITDQFRFLMKENVQAVVYIMISFLTAS